MAPPIWYMMSDQLADEGGDGAARVASARVSPLTTINRTGRSEEVRRQIERAILSKQFAPGERLPSERELIETFGVSRVSVREAIRSLEALGLVRVYQGRGAFVSDRRSGLGEPMARWLEMHRHEVLELLDVRGALDEYAAVSAVKNGNREALEKVKKAQNAFAAAARSREPTSELVALDTEFHIAIAEAGGNRLLYDLLTDLHSYLAESRYLALTPSNRPRRSAEEHAAIVDALVASDAEGARAATAAHIASVRALIGAELAAEKRRGRRSATGASGKGAE
jgi:DNA-binding FadR family transcriptional regulator